MSAFAFAFRPLLLLAISVLVIFTLSRLVLLFVFHERVLAVDGTSLVLIQGLRFDFVMIGLLLIIPTLLAPVLITHSTVSDCMEDLDVYMDSYNDNDRVVYGTSNHFIC